MPTLLNEGTVVAQTTSGDSVLSRDHYQVVLDSALFGTGSGYQTTDLPIAGVDINKAVVVLEMISYSDSNTLPLNEWRYTVGFEFIDANTLRVGAFAGAAINTVVRLATVQGGAIQMSSVNLMRFTVVNYG
jgi:hypothetical protein